MNIIKKKKYKDLIDNPKNNLEKEFDEIYEEYKDMFKTDPVYIRVISRRIYGIKNKIGIRFIIYATDRTLLDLYHEKKNGPSLAYLK